MEKFRKWWENYWYHYKWETLIIGFFAIFLIIASVQMFTKDKIDINVMYTGPHVFTASEIKSVESAFEMTMTADYNGDGEKGATFMDISLMTEEQILKAKDEYSETYGENLVIDVNSMRETEKKFNMQIFAGESEICLLDPYWYNVVKESNGFRKLSDVLGYTPENMLDEYSVYLRDTQFGQYFTVFQYFPEDTVLCMRTMSTTSVFKNKSSEKKRYSWHEQALRDIFDFTFPEGYIPGTTETAS